MECFEDPTVGCVADGGGLALRYQARTNYMSPFHALERRQLPFLPFADGANACFRRAVFDAIGLFDESFYKGADVEFCYRMFVLTDYKLAFCRRAVVREAGEPTIGALLRQRFRIGMGSHLLRIKYPEFFLHHTPAGPVRRGYWRLLDACRRLRVPHGAPRPIGWSALQDGAVEFLMSRAQAFGRLYGRRELGRRKQVPARVDPDRAQRFVSAFDRFDERVLLV